jgi:hypothetical protein
MQLEQPFCVADAPHAVEPPLATTPSLEALLASVAHRRLVPDDGATLLGTLAGWDEAGQPLVAYAGGLEEEPIPALTTVPLCLEHVGREVVLLFVGGNPRRAVVIGLVQPPGPTAAVPVPGNVEACLDGERLEFTAGREIVFRCGAASITMTRAGKVLIQGAYLLSHSSGVNRIKGGAVQIN